MIVVHHLNNSRSQRLLWMLEELKLDYEIKKYERDTKTMFAPASLREVHPLGKSPVLSIDGRNLAESGAIMEYLVSRHGNGQLRPDPESDDWIRYNYFLHYTEGSLMPPLLLKLVFDSIEKAPMPFFVRPIAKAISKKTKAEFILPNIKRHLDFLESSLDGRDWFASDDLTAADIQMSYPLEAAASRAGLNSSRPNLMAFLERIHARQAYKTALEKGGEYNFF